jgi:hypothetical protein
VHRLAGRPIFAVGDRIVAWEDVLIAAYVWSDFAALERRVAATLAAEAAAPSAPDEDEVDEAAERWRYDRDLISADDLESWLSERGLTEDEWLAWVQRSVVAERVDTARAKQPGPREIEPLLFVEAMCSGWAGDVIAKLAGRAAVVDRATSEGPVRAPAKAKVDAALGRLPNAVRKRGLGGLSASECAERARWIVLGDVVCERFVKSASTTEALAREVGAHALEWTRLDTEMLVFGDEGAAKEAVLLVRQDGLSMADAAAAARCEVVAATWFLEDVAASLRGRLTSAQPGDLIGPVAGEGRFTVLLVTQRVVPTVDDRAVRDRALQRIERRIVGAEIDDRVRWYERF